MPLKRVRQIQTVEEGDIEPKKGRPSKKQGVADNGDSKAKRGRPVKSASVESQPKTGRGKKASVKESSDVEEDEREETPPVEPKAKKGKNKKKSVPKVEEGDVPKRSRRQVKAPIYEEKEDDEESEPEYLPEKEKMESDEELLVEKPKAVARSRKEPKASLKTVKKDDIDESDGSDSEPKPKGNAKGKAASTSNSKGADGLMNQTETDYKKIVFSCDKENSLGEQPNFSIASWNVDGLRAWLKKDGLMYMEYEKPDIFCVQESKCSQDKLPSEVKEFDGYKIYWHNSNKEGYAGVGLFSRTEPLSVQYGIGVEEHDEEGRCVTAEYDKFYVVSVYVPNAGRKLVTLPKRLEWNKAFKTYIKELDEKKPVIICGDMNVAHSEIDLTNPKTNTKNAGFTKEEREGMTEFLADGYVDTFRKFYPDKTGAYTFWTYMMKCRAKNVGWRLDYFIVSERLVDNVCDSVIRNEVFGSDHCPIVLFLNA